MEVRPAWPAELLRARRLTVISDAPGPEPEPELAALAARVPAAVRCDGRDDLERGLGALLAAVPAAPVVAAKTLDLYGHATGDDGLLRLGGWLIDGRSPRVTAFFRGLAEHDVLPRLGVYAVRLLACRTADTHAGRATICALADVLGLEVYGTPNLIHAAHVDADGFAPCWEHLLVGSCDLRRTTPERELEPAGVPWPRWLDIDALPSVALATRPGAGPRRLATPGRARALLALVDRRGGEQVHGLLVSPSCEIALPAVRPGEHHLVQVLLDGAYVRFFPDGAGPAGVIYPVSDPPRLRQLVSALPQIAAAA